MPRPSAVGKKNFLFIGSPNAGKRSAIIYSIIVSCQRHGIDPLGYMTDLLHRLPNMSNQEDLDPLLPANWKKLDRTRSKHRQRSNLIDVDYIMRGPRSTLTVHYISTFLMHRIRNVLYRVPGRSASHPGLSHSSEFSDHGTWLPIGQQSRMFIRSFCLQLPSTVLSLLHN